MRQLLAVVLTIAVFCSAVAIFSLSLRVSTLEVKIAEQEKQLEVQKERLDHQLGTIEKINQAKAMAISQVDLLAKKQEELTAEHKQLQEEVADLAKRAKGLEKAVLLIFDVLEAEAKVSSAIDTYEKSLLLKRVADLEAKIQLVGK